MDIKKKVLTILTSVAMIFTFSSCKINDNSENREIMMDEDIIIEDFPHVFGKDINVLNREKEARELLLNLLKENVSSEVISKEEIESGLSKCNFDEGREELIESLINRYCVYKPTKGIENKEDGIYINILDCNTMEDEYIKASQDGFLWFRYFSSFGSTRVSYKFDNENYEEFSILLQEGGLPIVTPNLEMYHEMKITFCPGKSCVKVSMDGYGNTENYEIPVEEKQFLSVIKMINSVDLLDLNQTFFRLEKLSLGIDPFSKKDEDIYYNDGMVNIRNKVIADFNNTEGTIDEELYQKSIAEIKDPNGNVNTLTDVMMQTLLKRGYEEAEDSIHPTFTKNGDTIEFTHCDLSRSVGNWDYRITFTNCYDNIYSMYLNFANEKIVSDFIFMLMDEALYFNVTERDSLKSYSDKISVSKEQYEILYELFTTKHEDLTLLDVYSWFSKIKNDINPLEDVSVEEYRTDFDNIINSISDNKIRTLKK